MLNNSKRCLCVWWGGGGGGGISLLILIEKYHTDKNVAINNKVLHQCSFLYNILYIDLLIW